MRRFLAAPFIVSFVIVAVMAAMCLLFYRMISGDDDISEIKKIFDIDIDNDL